MLLGLQREGVHVDARVRGASVVQVRLDAVEVLTSLLLEAVLAVENHLEQVQRTHLGGASAEVAVLNPVAVAAELLGLGRGHGASTVQDQGAARVVRNLPVVGDGHGGNVARDVHVAGVGGEVPHGVQVGTLDRQGSADGDVGVGVAPDELLHGVVEGQADQLNVGLGIGARAGTVEDGVATGVLNLLNQVLVTLLGEAATLLSVQVHVVGPHLERGGGAEIQAVVAGQVKVQTHLVVLQSNQGQVQTGVAVEEEQQRDVHTVLGGAAQNAGEAGHLAPGQLISLIQEQLGVQAPPHLVVLINTLATDGQLNGGNRTLSQPAGVVLSVVGGQVLGQGGQGHVHVADQVAVTGDGHGHATAGRRAAVGRLRNQLHREVGVTLVHRLEEGHLGLTRQIHILSTVSNELHKSTRHDFTWYYIPKKKKSRESLSRARSDDASYFL